MRIARRIVVLVVFLLCVLGANTYIGLKHIANIRSELFAVANQDMAFMEDVAAIHRLQLEKAVTLQRLIGIAEEMGFESINPTRRQYLNDQLSDMGRIFDRFKGQISLHIQRAKDHREQDMSIQRIVVSFEQYDLLITGILQATHAGGFQLSLEDLDRLRIKDGAITDDLGNLLKSVEASVRSSLDKTDRLQQEARQLLLISLGISVVVAFFLLIWTMVSIAAFNALNKELKAANAERDNFIQVVSKDIVNPLTGMIAYCAYIEGHAGTTMDEKNLEALQGIRRSCAKTQKIARDLLDFSQNKRAKT